MIRHTNIGVQSLGPLILYDGSYKTDENSKLLRILYDKSYKAYYGELCRTEVVSSKQLTTLLISNKLYKKIKDIYVIVIFVLQSIS